MIKCPNCHHEELPGSLYCSECGAQLVVSQTTTTQHIQRNPSDVLVVLPNQAFTRKAKQNLRFC